MRSIVVNAPQIRSMFVPLQKVMMFQNTVNVYSQLPFQMVLLQLDSRYCPGVLRRFSTSNIICVVINPGQRCVPVEELFDEELMSMPRIRRMKSYHLPCQHHVNLLCFVDEFNLCLCTTDHQSNCFPFDQKRSFICDDNVFCQNGGTGHEDQPICPLSILCVCQDCFFGDRCQFYAKGIGLTLDEMLRYIIRPHVPFHDQSLAMKWSAAITIIVSLVGPLNSFFAFVVFNHQNTRRVGSGVYLLLSSIVCLPLLTVDRHIQHDASVDPFRRSILCESVLCFLHHFQHGASTSGDSNSTELWTATMKSVQRSQTTHRQTDRSGHLGLSSFSHLVALGILHLVCSIDIHIRHICPSVHLVNSSAERLDHLLATAGQRQMKSEPRHDGNRSIDKGTVIEWYRWTGILFESKIRDFVVRFLTLSRESICRRYSYSWCYVNVRKTVASNSKSWRCRSYHRWLSTFTPHCISKSPILGRTSPTVIERRLT